MEQNYQTEHQKTTTLWYKWMEDTSLNQTRGKQNKKTVSDSNNDRFGSNRLSTQQNRKLNYDKSERVVPFVFYLNWPT